MKQTKTTNFTMTTFDNRKLFKKVMDYDIEVNKAIREELKRVDALQYDANENEITGN